MVQKEMVTDVYRNCKPNIICFEETKQCNSTTQLLESLNFNRQMKFITRSARGASKGIMIGVNNRDFEILDSFSESYCATVVVRS